LAKDTRTVGDVTFELFRLGAGEPLVVLHDAEYLATGTDPFLERLAEQFDVLLPSHPGFGGSTLPDSFDSVDDLAFAYLDLLREVYDGQPVHLVGLGFGGWIAAELAVRCTHGLRSLTLVDALGIKVGGIEARDIADIYVVDTDELVRLSWHDPEVGGQLMKLPGRGGLPEEELTALLRNRQSTVLFGWRPFLHNPKLRARLRRIDVPTLVVWGESDGWVSVDYGRAYVAAIPGARFEVIPEAGHFPYLEQPGAFATTVTRWLSVEKNPGENPWRNPLEKNLVGGRA
jgi:pimeloyl-ACP methyl ester carboxylesterase